MAQRQADELVDQIRWRRHRLYRASGLSEFAERVTEHARRHPVAWIVGGTIVGAVSARLLAPSMARLSRGVAAHWLHSTLQEGVVSLARGAFWSLWPPGVANEVSAEWEPVSPDGEEPPMQASGGPVQPLKPS